MRLPKIQLSGYKPATLVSDSGTVITFQVPAQSIRQSRSSEYQSLTPLGGSSTFHLLKNSPNPNINLDGIIFGLHCNRDIRPYLEALDRFTKTGEKLTYSQGRTIPNLILQSYNWEETNYFGGYPVRANASLNFLVQGDKISPVITNIGKELTAAEINRIKSAASAKGFKSVAVDATTGNVYSQSKLIGTGTRSSPFFVKL